MAARWAARLVPEPTKFEGLWRVERDVIHQGAAPARFHGTARISQAGESWLYHETGRLNMQGHAPMQAERRYVWCGRPEGGIDVFFEDGRYFHSITGTGQAQHWCAPDMYDVTYDFGVWPQWCAVWQVRGPRKSYRMVSRYDRDCVPEPHRLP